MEKIKGDVNYIYSFDDVEINDNLLSVRSKKARRKIEALMYEHGFHFDLNPGGGYFYNKDRTINIQISNNSDIQDFIDSKRALNKLGYV